MPFDLTRYLTRVGLTDVPQGAAGLAAVQEAQMRAIPFEAIDPLLGRLPGLGADALMAKLVDGRRGGYCFEQNALLALALEALGYPVEILVGRVRSPAGIPGARAHQALRVHAEGQDWLCDAGFGGPGPLRPLLFTGEQVVPNGTYRLRDDPETGETTLQRLGDEGWRAIYGLDFSPVQQVDLEAANFLCAHWDGTPFTRNLMLAFHAPHARIGLFNRALTEDGAARLIESAQDLAQVFETCGLAIPAQDLAAIWSRIEHAPTTR